MSRAARDLYKRKNTGLARFLISHPRASGGGLITYGANAGKPRQWILIKNPVLPIALLKPGAVAWYDLINEHFGTELMEDLEGGEASRKNQRGPIAFS